MKKRKTKRENEILWRGTVASADSGNCLWTLNRERQTCGKFDGKFHFPFPS